MSIEWTCIPKEIFRAEKFSLLAIDTSEEFTTIRTLKFVTAANEIIIGVYFTDGIAGTHEYCMYDENYVAILSKNKYGSEPIISVDTLFDIENLSFVEGTQEELKTKLEELQNKSKTPEKVYKKI